MSKGKSKSGVSNSLIVKLSVSFLLIVLLIGVSYVLVTAYFSKKYYEETTQYLNAEVANHLIQEKFQGDSPFLEGGEVNKPLFGDIMHDMMAVNQGIEVYLLGLDGSILYSVVLDPNSPEAQMLKVDTNVIEQFISAGGEEYILGDNPRNPNEKKIFSAARFEKDGQEGYIYIILAGQKFDEAMASLGSSYFIKLGTGTLILTILFAGGLGIALIIYLTRQLRTIIFTANRFKDGDLTARIENPEQTDLSTLSVTFNEMADKIVKNLEERNSIEKLRQELIANVSHDLRTPLAIMSGYVETLQIKNEQLTEEQRQDYLYIIKRRTESLSHLVSQLFEYSKLESNQIEPEKEAFNISELAHDVYANFKLLADNKEIKLNLDVQDKTPFVFADISLVERVLQNLIDNALKFTPNKGEVTLKIGFTDSDVSVSVSDTGPGITEQEKVHIFERYRQAKETKTKIEAGSGSGLGLAIVKKIIDIHNTTIRVISQPNQGTQFEFYLPAYGN